MGNICRSPLADGLLRDKIKKHNINAIVDSAGTISMHAGEAPDPRSIQVGLLHGVDIRDLRARQFNVSDFDTFDHIYVMDSANYTDVMRVARDKSDMNKVEIIMNLVYPNKNKPVPDPYFGGDEGFEQVYQMLDLVTDKIIEIL